MAEDLASQAAGIGALAEPVRRALYEYVVSSADPVGREEAARAADVPVHTAKFHLDRLVAEGLLETEFRRLSERSGPGAGRPSKLYRRSAREFAVTLPGRRYALVGHILASAFDRAGRGDALDEALEAAAAQEGRSLVAGLVDGLVDGLGEVEGPDLERLGRALATQGYEPRVEGDELLLANCPFDSLAREHTELVCGLNRCFVQGVAEGLGCDVDARLDPDPDLCCVKARPRT